MLIKEIPIESLRNFSVDLLSNTFLQLRQTNISEDDVVSLSLILAEDLNEDFGNLHIEDIQKSFRLGIRNTDDFLIGPKVWYKWIKRHRDLIWQNEGKDEKQIDKRLKYRNRIGTGMKSLGNSIKQINYEK
tara:strand:- start:3258 stop:3650 length:393 start_codon:yes stop_codon:yes gene_type:complete